MHERPSSSQQAITAVVIVIVAFSTVSAGLLLALSDAPIAAQPTSTRFVIPTVEESLIATTSTPTHTMTDGACTSEQSRIESPQPGDSIQGSVNVTGTATLPNFSSYRLELREESEYTYQTIFTSAQPTNGGTLMRLNTTTYPNGVYWLRLVVVDANGRFPERCAVNIVIDN